MNSTEYYRTHPEAREKKKEYDTRLNARPEQVAKRVELNRHNREHDRKYGKQSREGKDLAHTKDGLIYKSVSANRGSKDDTEGDRRARGGWYKSQTERWTKKRRT